MVEKKPKFTVSEFVFLASAFHPLDKHDVELYAKILRRKDEEER